MGSWASPAFRASRAPPDLTVAEVRALLDTALPLPPRSPQLRQAWSRWRRAQRQCARDSHQRQAQTRAASHSPTRNVCVL